jgi:hypothetical protein
VAARGRARGRAPGGHRRPAIAGGPRGSLEFVQTIRPVPFGRQALIPILTAVGVPLLPLLLTMFPLDELLSKLAGILL